MKLDIGKILNSINKGKKPSADTLFVSNPKDPRLKAYQDSADLYKTSLNEKDIAAITQYGQYKKSNKKTGGNIQPLVRYMPDSKVVDSLDRAGKSYTKLVPSKPLSKKNQELYYLDSDGAVRDKKTNQYIIVDGSVYKKPVQPVKYKKGESRGADTLFVSNPKDPRIKKYQDSLSLYKRYQSDLNNRGKKVELSFNPNDNMLGPIKDQYAKNKIKPTRVDWYSGGYEGRGDAFIPVYKKPVQPVLYREEIKKKEEPKMVAVKEEVNRAVQNSYSGSPVYFPTAGSGGPSALVGFANNNDTTFIQPEDFERFAVPKYAKQFIQSKNKKK